MDEEKGKGTELIFIDLQVVSIQDQIYLIVVSQMKISEGGASGLVYDAVTTVYRANEPEKLEALFLDDSLEPQWMNWMETAWFHLKYSFALQFTLILMLLLLCIASIKLPRRKANC